MNKIPFSQMEGILTQKKDLRKNRCFITFLDATKVSNIKEFIDRSRSVAPFYPITINNSFSEKPSSSRRSSNLIALITEFRTTTAGI
jgi:hypothetical protein